MIRDALLAVGLLLSTATQLRLPGLPLGPGESLVATWVVLELARIVARRALPLTPALLRLLVFWTVFAFAQSLGQFVGLVTEEYRDVGGAIRTAGAYVLCAVLSCCVAVLPEARLHRLARTTAAAGAVSATLLIAGGLGALPVPGIDFWIFNRFVGWSMNPNQFALMCTVLVTLSLHLTETATRPRARLGALLCAVPAFVAGVLTLSDSFVLAILIVGPAFLASKLLDWTALTGRHLSFRTAFACLMILSLPGILIAIAPFAPKLIETASAVAVDTMEKNDQAEGRFRLWSDALQVGLDAGMLGLGPGPHLITKQWKILPPEKNEAHNSVLDLFTQGGLLASMSFLWVTALAFVTAYRARLIGLASLVVSLFVFSNFHLIVRHPIFWFSIALCIAAADAVRRNRFLMQAAEGPRIRGWPFPPRSRG